jgi:hypothetical protein
MMWSFKLALCVLLLSLCGTAWAQHEYRYNVELSDGSTMLGVWMYLDTANEQNFLWRSDTSQPIKLLRSRVDRILTMSDPIRPPATLDWLAKKDPTWLQPPLECDCDGRERRDGLQVFDLKAGLSYKRSNSVAQQTVNGPVTQTSSFFDPTNSASTNMTVELNTSAGYRYGKWDFGIMLEVIPTDSFFYFPLALHARYLFEPNCCSWNVFANAGLPLDFQTGAPVLFTPFFTKRQRRYASLGIGKIWPQVFGTRSSFGDFALDVGYRYMAIPLAEIQCCPTIPTNYRFPARESHSLFAQFGFSF